MIDILLIEMIEIYAVMIMLFEMMRVVFDACTLVFKLISDPHPRHYIT